jgi:glutamyl-tRNA synthetase
MEVMSDVRTRIAPSPTGYPHIGTIYQAMFDYALAKKYDGQFVNRLEDTDQVRFVEGAEEVIYKALDWFGLVADEDPRIGGPYAPYKQSERLDIYKEHVQKLIDSEHAYYCFCTKERLDEMRKNQEAQKLPPMYDKHCLHLSPEEIQQKKDSGETFVVRMKIPEDQTIKFTDTLAGDIEFDSNLIDHQVILKSDGFPTYHLAVVVDDYLMKISHIIRGKEWVSSTPKHILLYQYFGWGDSIPSYTHVPLILNEDGKGKLSKRFGHTSVDYYKKEGFLPEAILNYLTNLIWNHPEGKEIYPFSEFEKAFDLDSKRVINITSQGPRFNLKKLEWINGEYIRAMSDEELTSRLQEFLVDHPRKDQISPLVPLIKERIKKLSDFIPLTNFIFDEPEYDVEVFNKIKIPEQSRILENIIQTVEAMGKSWDSLEFEKAFREMAEKELISVGDMFQFLRAAISGQLVTPPLFESIKIIGEEKVVLRLKKLLSQPEVLKSSNN